MLNWSKGKLNHRTCHPRRFQDLFFVPVECEDWLRLIFHTKAQRQTHIDIKQDNLDQKRTLQLLLVLEETN